MRKIIRSDHGNVFRYSFSRFLECVYDAEGAAVGSSDDGVNRKPGLQNLFHCGITVFLEKAALFVIFGSEFQTDSGRGVVEILPVLFRIPGCVNRFMEKQKVASALLFQIRESFHIGVFEPGADGVAEVGGFVASGENDFSGFAEFFSPCPVGFQDGMIEISFRTRSEEFIQSFPVDRTVVVEEKCFRDDSVFACGSGESFEDILVVEPVDRASRNILFSRLGDDADNFSFGALFCNIGAEPFFAEEDSAVGETCENFVDGWNCDSDFFGQCRFRRNSVAWVACRNDVFHNILFNQFRTGNFFQPHVFSRFI